MQIPEVLDKLVALGLLDRETMELVPEAVSEICEAFAEEFLTKCPGCLLHDYSFWSLPPEKRILHIVAYGLSLLTKKFVDPAKLAAVVKVSERVSEACREAFARMGLGW
jgi:hypothetical protein